MGFSLGKTLKSVASVAIPAAVGYFTGGTGLAAASALGGNSAVSGAVGLGMDWLQSQSNLQNQKDLAKYSAQMQMALNQQTQDYNLQMWNLTNEYNSPKAQMQRYKDAGLNPNLIYGQSNTTGMAPMMDAPKYDAGQYHPVDKSAMRQQAQLALMEFNQRIKSQALDNELKREQLLLAAKASERADKLANAQIYNLMQTAGYTDARTDRLNNLPLPDNRPASVKEIEYWGNKLSPITEPIGNFVGYLNGKMTDGYNWYKNSSFHRYLRR